MTVADTRRRGSWKIATQQLLESQRTMAAIGLTGALAGCMHPARQPTGPLCVAAYAAVRRGIERIGTWPLPSLLPALTGGPLATAAHLACVKARRARLEAALGLSMFVSALVDLQGPAEHAAATTPRAAAGKVHAPQGAGRLRDEWRPLWSIPGLAAVNLVPAG